MDGWKFGWMVGRTRMDVVVMTDIHERCAHVQ